MFDYFRNYSSNADHVGCEDSPTKGLVYNDHCQSDDLELHSRSHVRLKLTCLLFNLQYIGQHLSYYIATWHGGRLMHGLEPDHDFEKVCKACLTCFIWTRRNNVQSFSR